MKRIGITGGIGSGKSLVCSHIRDKGYFVINADALVASLLEDADIIKRVGEVLGDGCIKKNKVDKKKVSDIILAPGGLRAQDNAPSRGRPSLDRKSVV